MPTNCKTGNEWAGNEHSMGEKAVKSIRADQSHKLNQTNKP